MGKDNVKRSDKLREAIEEAKRLENDPKTRRYTNMDEMWRDIDKCFSTPQ